MDRRRTGGAGACAAAKPALLSIRLASTGWNTIGGRSNRKNTKTIVPMNRMKNCIGIFAIALKIRLSRLWLMELPLK